MCSAREIQAREDLLSATTAAPMPIPALVPMPTKALAVIIPAQVGAAPLAQWATIPIALTKMKIGLLPYTLAIGDHSSGLTPANRMAIVVL